MPQRLKPDSTSESNDLRNAGLKVTLPRLKILDILADGSASADIESSMEAPLPRVSAYVIAP